MTDVKRGRGRPRKAGLKVSAEDLELLSAAEIATLEHEAEVEAIDEHKDKIKASVRAKFKAAKVRELRGITDEEDEMRTILLDLAPHSDRITLDGKVFFHGQSYTVPRDVFGVLNECMARGWQHEDEVGNANQKSYRRPRELRIGPRDANIAASALLRV